VPALAVIMQLRPIAARASPRGSCKIMLAIHPFLKIHMGPGLAISRA